jgi:Superinfection immunity protein
MNVEGFLILTAISIAIYFAPAIVAKVRDHRNLLAIGMLNLFLGWTLVGWVAALVWACMNDTSTTKEQRVAERQAAAAERFERRRAAGPRQFVIGMAIWAAFLVFAAFSLLVK